MRGDDTYRQGLTRPMRGDDTYRQGLTTEDHLNYVSVKLFCWHYIVDDHRLPYAKNSVEKIVGETENISSTVGVCWKCLENNRRHFFLSISMIDG